MAACAPPHTQSWHFQIEVEPHTNSVSKPSEKSSHIGLSFQGVRDTPAQPKTWSLRTLPFTWALDFGFLRATPWEEPLRFFCWNGMEHGEDSGCSSLSGFCSHQLEDHPDYQLSFPGLMLSLSLRGRWCRRSVLCCRLDCSLLLRPFFLAWAAALPVQDVVVYTLLGFRPPLQPVLALTAAFVVAAFAFRRRTLPVPLLPSLRIWMSITLQLHVVSWLRGRGLDNCCGLTPRRNFLGVTLHYITLHYITLHYITLHYIALPCIA